MSSSTLPVTRAVAITVSSATSAQLLQRAARLGLDLLADVLDPALALGLELLAQPLALGLAYASRLAQDLLGLPARVVHQRPMLLEQAASPRGRGRPRRGTRGSAAAARR